MPRSLLRHLQARGVDRSAARVAKVKREDYERNVSTLRLFRQAKSDSSAVAELERKIAGYEEE